MKKIISILITALMLVACFATFVSAEDDDTAVLTIGASGQGDLPFELVPPAYVSAKWAEGGDSPTTTILSYSLSNEMTTFFKDMENAHFDETIDQFMDNIGCDDIWMNVQVDWALDDVDDPVSGWHYTEYWDGDEYFGLGRDSEGNSRWSDWDVVDGGLNNATETVQEIWITRGVPNGDRWNGNPDTKTPGVKDQLNPGQYTYDEENEELYIDYTEHTFYFRARFVVTVRNEGDEVSDKYYFSDWSNVASVGKDAETFEPLTEDDLKAPEITDLRMTDEEFNDCPVVAYTLTVPDELAENATKLASAGGGIVVETEARVKGDSEWVLMGNADWIIKAGEMTCALVTLVNDEHPTIDKDTDIELRCRYRCSQAGLDDIYSGYSEVITFKTDEFGGGDDTAEDIAPVPDETEPVKQDVKEEEEDEDKCPICHFCPRPLGLCIFIWIAIIVVVIVVVIVVIKVAKKSKK